MKKQNDGTIQVANEILNLLGKVVDNTQNISSVIKDLNKDLNRNTIALGIGGYFALKNSGVEIEKPSVKDVIKTELKKEEIKVEPKKEPIVKDTNKYDKDVIGVMGMQLGDTPKEKQKLKTIFKEVEKQGTIKSYGSQKPLETPPKTSKEEYDNYMSEMKKKRSRKGELDFSFLVDAFKGFKNKFKKEFEPKKSIRDIIMEASYPKKEEDVKEKQKVKNNKEPLVSNSVKNISKFVGGVAVGTKVALNYLAPGESGTFSNIEGYNRGMEQASNSPTEIINWVRYGFSKLDDLSVIIGRGMTGITKGVG